jgi:DNA invertase Pin-like site-specific DNA recombinase
MAELMMTVLAGIAKFERALIRVSRKEIAIAKAKGVYKVRRKALKPEEAIQLREMAEAGTPAQGAQS